MSEIQIYHGDCVDILKSIPEGSVDMVLTSPPYDNLRDYEGNMGDWNHVKFQQIANELYRVIKTGAAIVWIVADATIDGSETGTSFRQALYFTELGMNLHDTMIWEKPTFTATGTLKYRYASVFEYMFVFSKGSVKTFNTIMDKKNKYSGEWRSATNIRTQDGMRKMGHGHTIREYGIRHNVWHVSPVKSSKERCGHPAPFPLALARDHIISWSNKGDLILDPFMGSGTTCVAAYELGRDCIGIEKAETYFNIAKSRIETRQKQGIQGDLFE